MSTPRHVWLFFETAMIASATCLRIAGLSRSGGSFRPLRGTHGSTA